jgi:hypothetical protein
MINKPLHDLLFQAWGSADLDNSYLEYHNPGLAYICLLRTDVLTLKLYILDREKLAYANRTWIVHPHDHQYGFRTTVIHGSIDNLTFGKESGGMQYDKYVWNPVTKSAVKCPDRTSFGLRCRTYQQGENFTINEGSVHTLSMRAPRANTPRFTVLLQEQWSDTRNGSYMYVHPESEYVEEDCHYKGMTHEDVIQLTTDLRDDIHGKG